MPKGYLIAQVQIRNLDGFKRYVEQVPDVAKAFGGQYLVRGGESETREGETFPRHVIIEFPSYADAKAFYDSPEYAEIIGLRTDNTDTVLVLVEGL